QVGEQHVRPEVAGDVVEAGDARGGVVVGQDREHPRDLDGVVGGPALDVGDAAEVERGVGAGLEDALHGGELGGLGAEDELGQQVAGEGLEERGDRADGQGDAHGRADVSVSPAAEPGGRVDRRDGEGDGDVAAQGRVQGHDDPGVALVD